MAFKHGKDSYVSIGGTSLGPFTNNVSFNRSADAHDVTTLGNQSHAFVGGLLSGEATLVGIYDDAAMGPRGVIEPLIGTVTVLVYRPAGTGTGRPQDTVSVLVKAYEETAPVADMITWSAALQMTGEVATINQV